MNNIISINTKEYSKDKLYDIYGVSYAGNPSDNTALFIGKKVERFVLNLAERKECLVFIDSNVDVPADIEKNNLFVKSNNPQYEYALFAKEIEKKISILNSKKKYIKTDAGYYIGENVVIGENAIIENNVFIGHDVIIGDNVKILSGAKLNNCIIGDNCIISENATIGSFAANVASKDGNSILIPMLGNVTIKNNVYVGVSVDIPRSMAGATIIDNNVVIGTNSSIGHDDYIGENTIITANVTIGGYTTIGQNVYIGLAACVKNRISIGDNVYICMGSVVIRDIDNNIKVFGNPAKKILI